MIGSRLVERLPLRDGFLPAPVPFAPGRVRFFRASGTSLLASFLLSLLAPFFSSFLAPFLVCPVAKHCGEYHGGSFYEDRAEPDPKPGGGHGSAQDSCGRLPPRWTVAVYRMDVDIKCGGGMKQMLNVQECGLMRRTGRVNIDARSASSSWRIVLFIS